MPDLNPHDVCGTDCGVEVCGSVNGDIDDDDDDGDHERLISACMQLSVPQGSLRRPPKLGAEHVHFGSGPNPRRCRPSCRATFKTTTQVTLE